MSILIVMPNFARLTTFAFVLSSVTKQRALADLILFKLAIDENNTVRISGKIVRRNKHKLRCLQADDMQYTQPAKQRLASVALWRRAQRWSCKAV